MNLKLKIQRKYLKEQYAIGNLLYSINGSKEIFLCNTLEDEVRDLNKDGDLNDLGEEKVVGETAIPYGEYNVVIDYSPKYGRDMIRVLDVNNFTGILMHSGNTPKDSHGCILLGWNKEKGKVLDSKKAAEMVFQLVRSNGGKAKLVIE